MFAKLLEFLRSIPAPLVAGVAFLAPCAETALMLGVLVPGELIVVAAGVLAGHSRVPLLAVIVAAAAGAILGDSAGYFVGRRNPQTLSKRVPAERWSRTRDYLKARGNAAIFLARFTPFARTLMPPVAGAARVPYRRFLLLSSASGVLWGFGSVLLGYYASRQAERSLFWIGVGAAALLAVIIAVTFRRRRRVRARKASQAA